MINCRRSQAQRSIVVQVASEKSYNELYRHCAELGNIESAFYYTIQSKAPRNFILIEFDGIHAVQRALDSSILGNFSTGSIPVQSPFLWFKSVNNSKMTTPTISQPPIQLNTGNRLDRLPDTQLRDVLSRADSISHQMELLYENTRLNELSIRLRFLGAYQIENVLKGLLAKSFVVPFGSTVNGFGKMESDLDMILQYNIDCLEGVDGALKTKRLVNHVKSFDDDDSGEKKRDTIKKHLRTFAAILDDFMPGALRVTGIYSARVPIIRYYHDYLQLDADISITNM